MIQVVFTVLCLLCMPILRGVSLADESLQSLHTNLNTYYDSFRPPLRVHFAGQQVTPVKASNYHAKRCSHTDPGAAISLYQNGAYGKYLGEQAVLVGSPCLFSDSLGNWLSNYFESMLCANAAGMHYVTVAKIWEPRTNDTSEPFLTKLPAFVKHPVPVSKDIAKVKLATSCPCASLCHEKPNALWTRNRDVIKPLLWGAIEHQIKAKELTNTTVVLSDLSTAKPGTVLPFVPEVAIHYRCGDNFVGHYGFLPFSAFRTLVPASTKMIFVLAEKRSRKTATKQHRAAKCDAIFNSLFSYLTQQFPRAEVVIRRGDDLYSDFIRLASAPVTICSVSSFCLWPAFVNPHVAHFPLTKLIVRRDASINLGFKWIAQPQVLLGAQYEHMQTNVLLEQLNKL